MNGDFEKYLEEFGEVGYVESIAAPLVYISGLPTVRPQELVVTENGSRGIVQVILADSVEVLMFETPRLAHGERVARTKTTAGLDVSDEILGRIVDPLGAPIDGKGPIGPPAGSQGGKSVHLPLDRPAPPVLERVRISEPCETGVTIIDLLVQIGKGQKELIAGDQKTGKSTFLLQAVTRQAQLGSICVYVFIGKKKSDLKAVEGHLLETGAFQNTVVIAASSSDPVAMVYFAPFAGFSVAEYFKEKGRDVLIILDDMTTHAKYYREIALVGKKTPGRGSYPGDVFHMQAKILERTGHVKLINGKTASITSLPVAETQEGDLTGFIQTNLMAMTDGHVFFDVEELKRGKLPAVNHSLSVTRVGNQTQTPVEKELRGMVIARLNSYFRVRETLTFGVNTPVDFARDVALGEKIEALFVQDPAAIIAKPLQHILFGLLFANFWEGKNTDQVRVEKGKIIKAYDDGRLKDLEGEVKKAASVKELIDSLNRFNKQITKVINGNIQQAATS